MADPTTGTIVVLCLIAFVVMLGFVYDLACKLYERKLRRRAEMSDFERETLIFQRGPRYGNVPNARWSGAERQWRSLETGLAMPEHLVRDWIRYERFHRNDPPPAPPNLVPAPTFNMPGPVTPEQLEEISAGLRAAGHPVVSAKIVPPEPKRWHLADTKRELDL